MAMAAAAWSSKGSAFEYACGFSIVEAIIPLYGLRHVPAGKSYLVVEVNTNFYVKKKESRKWLGSERFGATCPSVSEDQLGEALAVRLRDYWLSPPQITELLYKIGDWLSAGPTVLDLEVCSLQEEAAMRPGTLRPIELIPYMLVNPNPGPEDLFRLHPQVVNYEGVNWSDDLFGIMDLVFLASGLYEQGVRVDDADEGAAVMQQCGICAGRPFVGTVIAKLRYAMDVNLERAEDVLTHFCIWRVILLMGPLWMSVWCSACLGWEFRRRSTSMFSKKGKHPSTTCLWFFS